MAALSIDRRIISEPFVCDLPQDFPFRAAMCAVCLAHLGGQIIYSTGCAPDSDQAKKIAEFEAVERYSIVYDPRREAVFEPVMGRGPAPRIISQSALTLRSPGYSNSSRGSAAGGSFEAAARAALLERLEHHHLARFFDGKEELCEVDLARFDCVRPHLAWCAPRLRALSCRARWFAPGYAMAVCRSADLGGSRPTYGSAAADDPARAVLSAVEEALFSWRNMIELERRGVVPGAGDLAELTLHEYRGAIRARPWPDGPIFRAGHTTIASLPNLLEALVERVAAPVHVYDLTRAELGVPVARVHVTNSK